MSSQIFKNKIPTNILYELLNKLCIKTEKYYVFNMNSFKKGIYSNDIQEFINVCMPYYHISKRKYLDKKMTYKSFITIIRQICNHNFITYTSQIKYDHSAYEIVYNIYV